MHDSNCSHVWDMANVTGGQIVMKKCFHCGKVSICFCFHNKPPLETCHEEDHFWNFMESDPAFHFDLKCVKCGTVVEFRQLAGLMICTGCDERCPVDVLRRRLEREGTWVCIALCCLPCGERKRLADEKIAVLQEYFDQQNKSLKSPMRVVPHEMVRSIESCYAEVITDADMLFAASGGRK